MRLHVACDITAADDILLRSQFLVWLHREGCFRTVSEASEENPRRLSTVVTCLRLLESVWLTNVIPIMSFFTWAACRDLSEHKSFNGPDDHDLTWWGQLWGQRRRWRHNVCNIKHLRGTNKPWTVASIWSSCKTPLNNEREGFFCNYYVFLFRVRSWLLDQSELPNDNVDDSGRRWHYPSSHPYLRRNSTSGSCFDINENMTRTPLSACVVMVSHLPKCKTKAAQQNLREKKGTLISWKLKKINK